MAIPEQLPERLRMGVSNGNTHRSRMGVSNGNTHRLRMGVSNGNTHRLRIGVSNDNTRAITRAIKDGSVRWQYPSIKDSLKWTKFPPYGHLNWLLPWSGQSFHLIDTKTGWIHEVDHVSTFWTLKLVESMKWTKFPPYGHLNWLLPWSGQSVHFIAHTNNTLAPSSGFLMCHGWVSTGKKHCIATGRDTSSRCPSWWLWDNGRKSQC